MISEERVRWMLDRINKEPITDANNFTIRAIQTTLKIILEIDPDDAISIMEGLHERREEMGGINK